MKPLLVTLGDPNGLGPELACRLFGLGGSGSLPLVPLILIGPEAALRMHADLLGIAPFWTRIEDPERVSGEEPGVFLYEPIGLEGVTLNMGQATPHGGKGAGYSLEAACKLIRSGVADGVVTLPLHKAMLQEAGFNFPGHTEFLARFAGLRDEDVCMHLCGSKLRVSLVTTHPPLREVADLVTRERIKRCLVLTVDFVRKLGVKTPVAVCGLNPHAGESGKIGREDIEIVAPAVEDARKGGLSVVGPLPADTLFYRAAKGEFSAVLAMYHDQGLPPLKLMHFSRAVNVTLGLPFVRTSVDHGTGFDITGKGVADTGSFEEALTLAARLTEL
jgi:4-hydroxythreonine-4-phosphate dehydrogenase